MPYSRLSEPPRPGAVRSVGCFTYALRNSAALMPPLESLSIDLNT